VKGVLVKRRRATGFLGAALLVLLLGVVIAFEGAAGMFEGRGPHAVRASTVSGQGLLYTPRAASGEESNRKWPAIVFAHGLCGPAKRYSETLETLSSWGFVVLANQQQEDCGEGNIRHPFESVANFFIPGGKFSQAADSGAMAGHVKGNLEYLREKANVDSNAIALMGHSMGGGVVIDVAAELASSQPGAVKAVIGIAPWNGAKPTPSSVVSEVSAPILLFCSMSDALCPCRGPATITDTQGPITQPASIGIPILFGVGADPNWNGGTMAIYDNATNAAVIEVKGVNHFTIAGTNGRQMQALATWATDRYGLNFNRPTRSYERIPTLQYSVGFLYQHLKLRTSASMNVVSEAKKDGRIVKVLSK